MCMCSGVGVGVCRVCECTFYVFQFDIFISVSGMNVSWRCLLVCNFLFTSLRLANYSREPFANVT